MERVHSYTDVDLSYDEKYRPGQIWKDQKRSPTGMFMIVRIYERTYIDGNVALRVEGISSDSIDGIELEHNLDARSLERMYPHLLFDVNPERDSDYEK